MNKPKLSVIIVVFNMLREAPRSLFSLSGKYQEGVNGDEYEVIVIDNGSDASISKAEIEAFGSNFRYFQNVHSESSPAGAMNYGISLARGDFLGLMIDGARIASPGLLRFALAGLKLAKRPLVSTLAWHLGPDIQHKSIKKGYTQSVEDELLRDINWRENGYDLFTISTLAESSAGGFFRAINESNAIFVTKEMVAELSGFDEKFNLPGGGFVNLDFYKRACELQGAKLITLIGEGTFHQVHGGIATNRKTSDYLLKAHEQYRALRGCSFRGPTKGGIFLGHFPSQIISVMEYSLETYSRMRHGES